MAENGRQTGELTARQQRALAALLREPTLRDAAKASGVGERTLFAWLQLPAFAQAYREARGQLLESTLTALQKASGRAVAALVEVLDEPGAKPGERVSAARAVLEFSLRAREVLEVEERLKALEARFANVQQSRRGTF